MRNYKLFDHYQALEAHIVILAFKGSISDKILIGMAEMINVKLLCKGEEQKIIKKIFSTFVELAQNIHLYSAEKTGEGIIAVEEHKNCYKINSGNLTGNSEIRSLADKISYINTLGRDQLRVFYNRQLKSERKAGKVGGNVGLIGIARESGNPICLTVNHIDENQSFIEISVKISKNMVKI